MRVLRRLPKGPVRLASPVAAIGIFDGVHRGHQKILQKAVTRAKIISGTPMAVTFYPHPLAVLAPTIVPPQILSLDERLRVFAALGIRTALVIPFTKRFSLWSAKEFIERLLVGRLHVKEVVVGHDFGFGHNRSGTTQTLKTLGRRFGFQVHVVAPVKEGGKRISSRLIRQEIREGHLSQVARYAGSPVSVVGKVVRGSKRGKGLGFPTANLKVEAGVLPPVGVYAVRAKLKGHLLPGMANIGFRPTFSSTSPSPLRGEGRDEGSRPLVEVHIFGIKRSLYGKELEVSFIKRLRPERRFASPQALADQLEIDARQARRILGRVFLIVVVLAITVLHAIPSYARDDWDLWTELRWKKPISEKAALFGTINGRFRRNMGEFYQQHNDLGLIFKTLPWLKVEPAYQWNFQERARTHDTVQEHRLYINLTPHAELGAIQLEDRNRMEFRHVNGKDDWRYRNRPKVSAALGKDHWWHMKPYLADEIFYGFRAAEINRNRFLAGIERPLRKNLSVELFYVVQSDKTGKDWSEFHALGLATNVTF